MNGHVFWLIILHLIGIVSFSARAVDISFSGELIEYPCKLDTESENKTVQFPEYPVKSFYISSGRMPAQKFNIKLRDCDKSSLWKTVKLIFTGVHETNMNGDSDYYLKINGVNTGKLAVGLLDVDGSTLLKLGEAHNNMKRGGLVDGSMTFAFFAFVQATPDAISNKDIQPGLYTSTVTFKLIYE